MPRLTAPLAVIGLLAVAAVSPAKPPTSQPLPQIMMANGYYFRETEDRQWYLTLTGKVPSLPGAYVVIIDPEHTIVLQQHIRHGEYPEHAPLVIEVPADGKAQDYKLFFIGKQPDMLGLNAPYSDLDYEVYGPHNFCSGHNATPLYFQAPEGVSEMDIRGYKASIRVFDANNKLVVDAKEHGQLDGYDYTADFPVTPGVTYRIEKDGFYYRSRSDMFLTFDPAKWFRPDPRLDDVTLDQLPLLQDKRKPQR